MRISLNKRPVFSWITFHVTVATAILATITFSGAHGETVDVEVNRFKTGDYFKPDQNATAEVCKSFGAKPHPSLEDYCLCQNENMASGTFMEKCEYVLGQKTGVKLF